MSIFQGRKDVYAKRWERDGKSGYMPDYQMNWDRYNQHKAKGGSFKTFQEKSPIPLTSNTVKSHLEGGRFIGVYPLFPDNTSFFIAADFDKANWIEESRRFIDVCTNAKVPTYLERSRSGAGGHVWMFFEEAYPAWKSRSVVFELLRRAGIISDFAKKGSFDRLFPNQDYLTGKGFGNLIALPLHGTTVPLGNTCFIDTESLQPYADQWLFLDTISKTPLNRLDELHSLTENHRSFPIPKMEGQLEIVLTNQIILNRNQLGLKMINFLKKELNFSNSDYFLKKKLGRSVFQTDKYFKLIVEDQEKITLPRGFIAKLIRFCKENTILYRLIDRRKKGEFVQYNSQIKLFEYQTKALAIAEKKDIGVIVAPPGAGKTVIALELIARKCQPAIIIVHRKQLFNQWLERIQTFLGIPKSEIGQISGTHHTIGNKITVAMIQSLSRMEDVKEVFGLVMIDECHHIPAKSFRKVIVRFSAHYMYGLTATPFRKNNDERMIFVYIGEILSQLEKRQTLPKTATGTLIRIRETRLSVPFDYRIDNYEILSNILVFDSQRNQMIVKDVLKEVEAGKQALILTERKSHAHVLSLYLNGLVEVIVITGQDSEKMRKLKLAQIASGHFQVIISTGQFFGEGVDIGELNCLFLVYPFGFKGKLIQYIGRVQRSEVCPVIYDYRDREVEYLENLFQKRKKYYKKLQKQETWELFSE